MDSTYLVSKVQVQAMHLYTLHFHFKQYILDWLQVLDLLYTFNI